jgi:hypothetical protein
LDFCGAYFVCANRFYLFCQGRISTRRGKAKNRSADQTCSRVQRRRANESEIKTALDFIDKVATMSGTSGEPYLIRFSDGSEVKSKDFLLAELRKLEN